jgi:hypothetical protein
VGCFREISSFLFLSFPSSLPFSLPSSLPPSLFPSLPPFRPSYLLMSASAGDKAFRKVLSTYCSSKGLW